MTPKARETVKMMKQMEFLKREVLRAIREAATFVADNIEDEKRIAEEIWKLIEKEAK